MGNNFRSICYLILQIHILFIFYDGYTIAVSPLWPLGAMRLTAVNVSPSGGLMPKKGDFYGILLVVQN